jgi:endonuclease YncB( thermonuclease family)
MTLVRIVCGLCALLSALPARAAPPADAIRLDRPADAVVVDGDTIQIGVRVVDLAGIDAPELGQDCRSGEVVWTCGLVAAYDLGKRLALADGPLVCEPQGRTGTGTLTAVCSLGTDVLAALQLESGLAVALPDAPFSYHALEERARGAALGIWHTDFVPPSVFRARHGGAGAGCAIRAVVTAAGAKLYFTPFDPPDARPAAVVSESPWCSDDVAREAGYRRPGETVDQPEAGPAASGSSR